MDNPYRIVPMVLEHVEGAVEMHLFAFQGFFLSLLGKGFLRELYKSAIGHKQAIGFVAVDSAGKVAGACFGAVNPQLFSREILRKRWWAFALRSIWPALRNPVIIPRLIRALRYEGNVPSCNISPLGYLMSTAVQPNVQGVGIAVALIRSVFDEYVRRGVHAVYLTTDADNNDRVRGFYEQLGCTLLGYYTTPEKRRMCWYLWESAAKVKKD